MHPLDVKGQLLDIEASISFYLEPGSTAPLSCGVRVLWSAMGGSESSGGGRDGASKYVDVLVEIAPSNHSTYEKFLVLSGHRDSRRLHGIRAQQEEPLRFSRKHQQKKRSALQADRDSGGSGSPRTVHSRSPVPGEEVTGVGQHSKRSVRGGRGGSSATPATAVATLRVLVDKAIVETFADGGASTAWVNAKHVVYDHDAAHVATSSGSAGSSSGGGGGGKLLRKSVRAANPLHVTHGGSKEVAAVANAAGAANAAPPSSSVGAVLLRGAGSVGQQEPAAGGRCEFDQLDVYPMRRFSYDTSKCGHRGGSPYCL